MTGIYSLPAPISMTHRSQSTQWHTLDANKTRSQKYTCGSDGIVLQCVKNDNPRCHLPTPSYSERVTVQKFWQYFCWKTSLPCYTESWWTPVYTSYGDLSTGWKCFQKLLISPPGWVERTHREKGFHNLPHPCQQRSELETRFLVWQCRGISIKLLQGRAVWGWRAEKHEMEKQCCSVNIDRCSLHSPTSAAQRSSSPPPSPCHSVDENITSLHLLAV